MFHCLDGQHFQLVLVVYVSSLWEYGKTLPFTFTNSRPCTHTHVLSHQQKHFISLHRIVSDLWDTLTPPPPPKQISYNLRSRGHGLTISAIPSEFMRRNFLYRMLYNDIY